MDTPVTGTIEEDKAVYTLGNYFDYPWRKMWIYEMLLVLGGINSLFPVTNFVSMPALGLAAYYNELF